MTVAEAGHLLTVAETAQRLSVSEDTVRRRMRDGVDPLPAVKFGGCVRVDPRALAAWIARRSAAPAPPRAAAWSEAEARGQAYWTRRP